jgi:Holliday junction resolvasome RuvABC DNA-binding subunit
MPLPPEYRPRPGGIGELMWKWLTNIPLIKDIIVYYTDRQEYWKLYKGRASKNALLSTLIFGPPEAKQAAAEALSERYPEEFSSLGEGQSWLLDFRKNPSAYIATLMRQATENPTFRELAESAGAAIYDSIIGLAVGGLGSVPPELGEKIRRFVGTVFLLSSGPKVMGALAEALSLGAVKTAGDIFRDAYYNLGLGFITWQSVSPLVDAAFGKELRRAANEIFRPATFSLTQVMDLYALGELGEGEVRQRLREDGYKEADIDRIIRLSFRTLPESTILDLWRNELIDEADAALRLRALGYRFDDAFLIMRNALLEKEKAMKEGLLSTARKAYKEDIIGEARFREILTDLNFAPAAIDLEISVLNLEKSEALRSLNTGQIREAYMNNVITDVEARNALMDLGYRTDEIPILIETWNKAKAPKVLKVNRQTILAALSAGVIDEGEARARLGSLGYSAEDVNLIIRTAIAEGTVQKPKVPLHYMLEAARAGLLSANQLVLELTYRGYTQDEANLLAQLALHREPPTLTAAQISRALTSGVIDETKADQLLAQLGYGAEERRVIIQTAIAYRPVPRPEAPLSVLMSLVRHKVMTEEELRTSLRQRGYSDADIAAIVSAATFEEPKPLSREILAQAFEAGIISRDEFMTRLIALGYTREDAEIIVATVQEALRVEAPTPAISTYVAACRDGIITPRELEEKLRNKGMAPEDISLFVELATWKPLPRAKELTKSEVLDAYKAFLFTRVEALKRLELLGYAIEDADIMLTMTRRDPKDSQIHPLYRSGILDEEQAKEALVALGYTEEQVDEYFRRYGRKR